MGRQEDNIRPFGVEGIMFSLLLGRLHSINNTNRAACAEWDEVSSAVAKRV